MSRCFPFPPPGYEKKPRPEDSSILKEEKQREKKQKKEKKEKEKREGKEKKDKERSDGKHRDKKDKKEKNKERKDKHREKKKERSKDKDKSSTSETSRVTGIPEATVEKLNAGDGKLDSYSAEEKNHPAQSHGHNGGRSVHSNLVASRTEEAELVLQLDKRIRVEQRSVGDELAEKFSGLDRKRDDEAHRFAAGNPGNLAEEKGKNSDKQFDNKKMEGQGAFSENSVVYSLSKTTEGKVEGIPKVVEKNDERRQGEKEKTKERGNDKRGDKHKDKDRDKKSHGKDKDREKERKKEKEKAKDTMGHKKNDQDKAEDGRSRIVGVIDSRSSSFSSDLHKKANVEGNLKKRKDVVVNGFLHDTEVRPHKLQRPTSHQVVENGRKLEACQIQSLLTSDRQPNAAILKVDEKEGRKNGIIEPLPLPATKSKFSAATADVDQTTAVLRKPPHPDSKYLSTVLSVPKMDEWSEFDDQEWLFASQDPRNPKMGGSGVGEQPQVWSKALHIESADVVALPYVIPY